MLEDFILRVDTSRSSRNVRDAFVSVKSSVADRFGPSAANTATDGAQLFAKMATEAHPGSLPAQVFTRLVYFSAAIAAAALDFSSGESALRPNPERLDSLANAIRFGEDVKGTEDKLRWAEAAIRDFAPNGSGIAEVVRKRFNEALQSIPAEGLAEVVVKMANTDRLFRSARDLEQAAYAIELLSFDDLSIDAKSFLGAILDFIGVERKHFADAGILHGRPLPLGRRLHKKRHHPTEQPCLETVTITPNPITQMENFSDSGRSIAVRSAPVRAPYLANTDPIPSSVKRQWGAGRCPRSGLRDIPGN